MTWISMCCQGERCAICKEPAEAKVGEEIMPDDPFPHRHNLTAYVCGKHFVEIFGEFGVALVNSTRENLEQIYSRDRKLLAALAGRDADTTSLRQDGGSEADGDQHGHAGTVDKATP